MKRAVLVVFGMLVAGPAYAQGHPCDVAVPPTQTLQSGAPHADQFCAKPSENLQGFVRVINGAASDLLPMTMKQAANAAGLAFYEGPKTVQLPRGSFQYQIRVYNLNVFTGATQLSEPSVPLSLTVDDSNPPPTVPVFKGLIR